MNKTAKTLENKVGKIIQEKLNVTSSSKIMNLNQMFMSLILNDRKPYSIARLARELKVTNKSVYRYCDELDHLVVVENGFIQLRQFSMSA
jgi:predicted DNA-binding transcriptional regulator YafY